MPPTLALVAHRKMAHAGGMGVASMAQDALHEGDMPTEKALKCPAVVLWDVH